MRSGACHSISNAVRRRSLMKENLVISGHFLIPCTRYSVLDTIYFFLLSQNSVNPFVLEPKNILKYGK